MSTKLAKGSNPAEVYANDVINKATDSEYEVLEPYYCAFIVMLTGCALHEKSDIAMVLAYQAKEIERLLAELKHAQQLLLSPGLGECLDAGVKHITESEDALCLAQLNFVAGVEQNGVTCPHCGDDDHFIIGSDFATMSAGEEYQCEKCGSTWEMQYALVGYDNLVAPS